VTPSNPASVPTISHIESASSVLTLTGLSAPLCGRFLEHGIVAIDFRADVPQHLRVTAAHGLIALVNVHAQKAVGIRHGDRLDRGGARFKRDCR
jgi:hypothetical protein